MMLSIILGLIFLYGGILIMEHFTFRRSDEEETKKVSTTKEEK